MSPRPASGLAADHRQRRGALRGEDAPDEERQGGRQTHLVASIWPICLVNFGLILVV